MAKTYGELILECQNYEYSKEHYELTKECYELDLMAQYVESNRFLTDNIDNIHEEFKEFDESYFVEAESIEIVTDNIEKKASGIRAKIKRGLQSIWKKICNFFTKLAAKSEKTITQNTTVKEELEAVAEESTAPSSNASSDNNTDIVTKIKNVVDAAWKDEYKVDGFMIPNRQPYAKEIHIKSLHNKANEYILNMLAVALSDTDIVIRTNGHKKLISLNDLLAVYSKVLSLNNTSDDEVKSIKKFINEKAKYVNTKGITINVAYISSEEVKNTFEDITNKLTSLMKESVDEEIGNDEVLTEAKKKGAPDDYMQKKQGEKAAINAPKEVIASDKPTSKKPTDVKNVANETSALKDVYTEVMTIAGNLMKLYHNIENYRAAVGKALGSIAKSNNSKQSESKAEDTIVEENK